MQSFSATLPLLFTKNPKCKPLNNGQHESHHGQKLDLTKKHVILGREKTNKGSKGRPLASLRVVVEQPLIIYVFVHV